MDWHSLRRPGTQERIDAQGSEASQALGRNVAGKVGRRETPLGIKHDRHGRVEVAPADASSEKNHEKKSQGNKNRLACGHDHTQEQKGTQKLYEKLDHFLEYRDIFFKRI